MFASLFAALKTRAGLMLALLGWIVMAAAIDTPATPTGTMQMVWLVIGFSLLIGGLITMILIDS